jgi:ureidoglycolate hydrolase
VTVVPPQTRTLPLRVEVMANPPLGSQAIAPPGNTSMLIVVAPAGRLDLARSSPFEPQDVRPSITDAVCGDHQLIALDRDVDFLIVDRASKGENLVLDLPNRSRARRRISSVGAQASRSSRPRTICDNVTAITRAPP